MVISETTLEEIALDWNDNRQVLLSAMSETPMCEKCESAYYRPAYRFDHGALDWYCESCGERVTDTVKPE